MVAVVDAGVGVRRVAYVDGANRSSRLAVHTRDRRDGRRVRKAGVGRRGAGVRRDRKRRVRLVDDEVPRRQPGQGVVVGRVGGHEVRRHCIGPRVRLGSSPAGENVRHRARHGTDRDANRGRLRRSQCRSCGELVTASVAVGVALLMTKFPADRPVRVL